MNLKLDDTPLPTDWERFDLLWADVENFALDHPGHTFLCADDPGVNHTPPRVGRLGWTAFLERPAGMDPEAPWDEQAKQWTITMPNAKRAILEPWDGSLSQPNKNLELERSLKTSDGRKEMLTNLQMRAGKKRWDLRFLEMAKLISTWSKDPSTKVGCVIVGPDREIRSTGFNGFPRGVNDTLARYNDREQKYPLVCHGEENAILHAARIGVSVKGCIAYCTWPPCTRCARSLAQVGIAEIVYPAGVEIPDRWKADFEMSSSLLKEAGVIARTV